MRDDKQAQARELGCSMASFIAGIDSNSNDVADYIAQRLLPLFELTGTALPITGATLDAVLNQIGMDGRALTRT